MLVIELRKKIIEIINEVMEEESIMVKMMEEILKWGMEVEVEMNFKVIIIEIKNGVERMVVKKVRRIGRI